MYGPYRGRFVAWVTTSGKGFQSLMVLGNKRLLKNGVVADMRLYVNCLLGVKWFDCPILSIQECQSDFTASFS